MKLTTHDHLETRLSFSEGIKLPEREADHSRPSRDEVKNSFSEGVKLPEREADYSRPSRD